MENSKRSTCSCILPNINFKTIGKTDFEKDTNRPLSNSVFNKSIQNKEMERYTYCYE